MMKCSRFKSMDTELSVVESGEGDPFVFQHGLCGDSGQPAQVFPYEDGYRCITVECRGHGRSEAGDASEYSIRTFADDISRYIDSTGMKPVLGGISMGAAIAIRLAVTRPELVRALIVARPAWVCKSDPENMAPNALAGDLLRTMPPADAFEAFMASDIAAKLKAEAPDNLVSLRGFFFRQSPASTGELLTRISASGPEISLEQIGQIDVPTLVIGHQHDFVHPISYAKQVAAAIPRARFTEITPKATSPVAYATDFRSALATFLKEL